MKLNIFGFTLILGIFLSSISYSKEKEFYFGGLLGYESTSLGHIATTGTPGDLNVLSSTDTFSSKGFTYGARVGWRFHRSWELSAEYTRFNLKTDWAFQTLFLNINFHFTDWIEGLFLGAKLGTGMTLSPTGTTTGQDGSLASYGGTKGFGALGLELGYDYFIQESFSIGPQFNAIWTAAMTSISFDGQVARYDTTIIYQGIAALKYWF